MPEAKNIHASIVNSTVPLYIKEKRKRDAERAVLQERLAKLEASESIGRTEDQKRMLDRMEEQG